MHRRDFLRNSLAAAASSRLLLTGGLLGGSMLWSPGAYAAAQDQRLVIQLTLDGGPDFRHLLVPEPSNEAGFAQTYWEQNFRSHGMADGKYDTAIARWDDAYTEVTLQGKTFGVLKKAGWLANLLQGNDDLGVALLSNMLGSSSRDHVHSLLALDYGRHDTEASEYGRSGWGGRLASTLGGRVVSLTRTPRNLCFAPDALGSNGRATSDSLLTFRDPRNAGLFDQRVQTPDEPKHWNAGESRALGGYYASLRGQSSNPRVQRFLDHEQQLRLLGKSLSDALADVGVPAKIAALTSGLHRPDFARQIAGVHDLINHAGQVINDMRVISVDYGGFDSHDNQRDMIEPNYEDLFGENGGLDSLFAEMTASAKANTVLVINGEFGRQTRSNRDAGTDHGRGNHMLVIGTGVQTGLHGDLFPDTEVDIMKAARLADIEGRTTIEHLHKAVADWANNGGDTGQNVVNRSLSGLALEDGVSLAQMFSQR